MTTVLIVAGAVAGFLVVAALCVAGLLWCGLWLRVRRANRRGLGPSRNAAAETVELPVRQQ